MSNYTAQAIHPDTGQVQLARFIEDHFGPGQFGVQFHNDGPVFSAENIETLPAQSRKIDMLQAVLDKETQDHQARLGHLIAEQSRATQLADELRKLTRQIISDNLAAVEALNAQVEQSMQVIVEDAEHRAHVLADEQKRIGE